jgi:hypothetical protein
MREKLEKLLDIFHEVKDELRKTEPSFYEKWKAGGFMVSNEFYSMYPNLQKLWEDLDGR